MTVVPLRRERASRPSRVVCQVLGHRPCSSRRLSSISLMRFQNASCTKRERFILPVGIVRSCLYSAASTYTVILAMLTPLFL